MLPFEMIHTTLNVDEVVQIGAADACAPQTLVCMWSSFRRKASCKSKHLWIVSECVGLLCVCIKTRARHGLRFDRETTWYESSATAGANPWRPISLLSYSAGQRQIGTDPIHGQQFSAVLRIFLHVLGFLPVPQLMKGYIRDVQK